MANAAGPWRGAAREVKRAGSHQNRRNPAGPG